MRLKPVQFRCRVAMRWPTMAGFVAAAPATAKAGKPHRDPAEKRRNRVISVVLHVANLATASAIRPSNGVPPGLRGNDLLLEACHQQLSVGYGQTETGDMVQIIRAVDLHNVDALLFTIFPGCHQPHNPSHASTSGQRTDAKIPLRRSHPQSCDGPKASQGNRITGGRPTRMAEARSGNGRVPPRSQKMP
jgi:hypothetical protein